MPTSHHHSTAWPKHMLMRACMWGQGMHQGETAPWRCVVTHAQGPRRHSPCAHRRLCPISCEERGRKEAYWSNQMNRQLEAACLGGAAASVGEQGKRARRAVRRVARGEHGLVQSTRSGHEYSAMSTSTFSRATSAYIHTEDVSAHVERAA